MTKKDPIPPLQTPVEKVIKQLMEEVQRSNKATIDGVIIHPSDLPTLGALLNNTPLPKPTRNPKFDEELARNVERMAKQQRPYRMPNRTSLSTALGQQASGVSWDEQHAHDKSTLERQLEDSLWALASHTERATNEAVGRHLPHLAGSKDRVRRVYEATVLILCPCKTVLQFYRCKYSGLKTGHCEEEVRITEGGSALCSLHR